MSGNIFFHEKKSERHIYQRKKTQSETVFLDHIRHLVSAMQGNTHSPYKNERCRIQLTNTASSL